MKENIVKNIGIVRVENVQTAFNTLSAVSVIPRIREHMPNAIKSNSGSIIPCKFNLNGTIKKGYLKSYKAFKEAEMSLGYKVFEFIHVEGKSF